MKFYLIYARCNLGCLKERVKVERLEIRHAERADLARAVSLLESAPRRCVNLLPIGRYLRHAGPMDKVEIEIIDAEVFKRYVDRRLRLFVPALGDPMLCREEYIAAVYTGRAYSLSDTDLVPVDPRGIDMTISRVKSRLHAVARGVPVGCLPCAESENRNLNSV